MPHATITASIPAAKISSRAPLPKASIRNVSSNAVRGASCHCAIGATMAPAKAPTATAAPTG